MHTIPDLDQFTESINKSLKELFTFDKEATNESLKDIHLALFYVMENVKFDDTRSQSLHNWRSNPRIANYTDNFDHIIVCKSSNELPSKEAVMEFLLLLTIPMIIKWEDASGDYSIDSPLMFHNNSTKHETLDIVALKLLAYIELTERDKFIIICSLARAIKIEDSAIVDIFYTFGHYNDDGTLDTKTNPIELWVKDVIGWPSLQR